MKQIIWIVRQDLTAVLVIREDDWPERYSFCDTSFCSKATNFASVEEANVVMKRLQSKYRNDRFAVVVFPAKALDWTAGS